jgi:hypothetical protein
MEKNAQNEEKLNCCLCGAEIKEDALGWKYGHNPAPYGEDDDRCCTQCNMTIVIPTRLNHATKYEK